MTTPTFVYEAFISYSHADARWASWLHRSIEAYRVPKRLIAERPELPARLAPIFRDREELPSAVDLGQKIEAALRASRRLIVVCSPRAATSQWVNEEIRRFKTMGRADQIFSIIVEGEPNAIARGKDLALECFPEQLRVDHGGAQRDPIAADVRPEGDGRRNAQFKLIAGMLGVGLDDLKQREAQRRQRRLVAVAVASFAGLIVTSALAAFALVARRDAEREAQTSRRTTEFMVQLFDVVDPGEARGRSITAYEILEKGVGQIHQLNDAPEVQATLLRTMGKVFTGLGLYTKAEDLLTESLATQARAGSKAADLLPAHVALADAQYLAGEYNEAENHYREALAQIPPGSPWDTVHSGAFNGLADVLTQKGRYDEALVQYRMAFAQDEATWGDASQQTARTLSGLASALLYDEKIEAAKVAFEKALESYRRSLGDDHPKVAETINKLGAVYYFSGDIGGAAGYYRRALPLYRKVYGSSHPEVAIILNNLARMELELGEVDAALPLLEESVTIDRNLGRSGHDDFVLGLSNLAVAYRSNGDLVRAEQLLGEARALAQSIDHRYWGPLLVDLADVYCLTHREADGLTLVREAAPKLRATYPHEPWRMALLDSVDGGCMSTAGKSERTEQELLDSYAVVAAHWGKRGLFTRDAAMRVAKYYERIGEPESAARYRVAANT